MSVNRGTPTQTPMPTGLNTPVQYCPGVGPKRAALLARLGLATVGDLFWHLPRIYEDFHHRIPLQHLQPGQTVTVAVEVKTVESRYLPKRSKVRHLLKAVVEDPTGSMLVTWFNQDFLTKHVVKGAFLALHGKVERRDYMLQMNSPALQVVDDDADSGGELRPVYPLTEGFTQTQLRKIFQKALDKFLPDIQEILPDDLLKHYQLPDRRTAFRVLHIPKPGEGAPVDTHQTEQNLFTWSEQNADIKTPASLWQRCRDRLVFEEFLQYQFMLRRFSQNLKKKDGIAHPLPNPDPFSAHSQTLDVRNSSHWPALFMQNLPFELTPDQQKVCQEIQKDMAQPQPMNRLLQGDVGTGKTVVSLYAVMLAVAGGHQAAMMAPTEILANQHANALREWTRGIVDINIVVLAGSATAAQKREIYSLLKSGAVQVVIGTHALFQERVQFDRLGLVVVDEQHKFGVEQRQRLVEKGKQPDLLIATATPIPRTLSLTLFGDMDVSIIKTKPPGRPPLITRWTTHENEAKLWNFVDEKIGLGQQAYVVCPLIETSETAAYLPSAEDTFERITKEFLPNRRVALLHGRHDADEKSRLIQQMREGKIDLLISTTVIEVGVDLPNATMMVVMGADRFGLAQLHQLRGRVGRGTLKSYCVLLTPTDISNYARQRMKILEKTQAGFLIAEEDLKLRGPGEHFGIKQSGHLNFRLADPYKDITWLQQARQAAHHLYEVDPDLKQALHQPLLEEILRKYGDFGSRRPS